jgi:hypothetical protein
MTKITAPRDAIAAIAAEAVAQGVPEADSETLAKGIFGGLCIGFGMDEGAFIAIHGNRLPHLTRDAMKAARFEVTAAPGEMPKNI